MRRCTANSEIPRLCGESRAQNWVEGRGAKNVHVTSVLIFSNTAIIKQIFFCGNTPLLLSVNIRSHEFPAGLLRQIFFLRKWGKFDRVKLTLAQCLEWSLTDLNFPPVYKQDSHSAKIDHGTSISWNSAIHPRNEFRFRVVDFQKSAFQISNLISWQPIGAGNWNSVTH